MGGLLQVSTASVRSAGAGCAEAAKALGGAGASLAGCGRPYQPSAAAITALLDDAVAARQVLATRIHNTADKLVAASTAYANTDAAGGAALNKQLV